MLTSRQIDVVKTIAQGLSCEEAGALLGISPRTVKEIRRNLAMRTGLMDRFPKTQNVYRIPHECVRRGWVAPEDLFAPIAVAVTA